MPRGGARPGAGRPKGSRNRVTVELQKRLAESGELPLDVMLSAMREAWKRKDLDLAVKFAAAAAPYVHPKLAAVEHTGKDGQDLAPKAEPQDVAGALFEILREARVNAPS